MMRGVIRGVGLCIFGLFLFGILLGGMAHLGKKSAQSRLEHQLEEGIAESEAEPAVEDLAGAGSEALFDGATGAAEHAAMEEWRRGRYEAGEAYRRSADFGQSSIGSAARKSAAPMTSAAPMVDPTPMVDTTPID